MNSSACATPPMMLRCIIADDDGCAATNPCEGVAGSNGTCLDEPAPNTGYTCACDAGRLWNGTACAGAWAEGGLFAAFMLTAAVAAVIVVGLLQVHECTTGYDRLCVLADIYLSHGKQPPRSSLRIHCQDC